MLLVEPTDLFKCTAYLASLVAVDFASLLRVRFSELSAFL